MEDDVQLFIRKLRGFLGDIKMNKNCNIIWGRKPHFISENRENMYLTCES